MAVLTLRDALSVGFAVHSAVFNKLFERRLGDYLSRGRTNRTENVSVASLESFPSRTSLAYKPSSTPQ